MARYELLFPSRYLGAPDLAGKDVTVKIASIKLEDIEGTDETGKSAVKQKGVVTLEGVAKPWILNRTNAEAIVLMFGAETQEWKGKPITLHATLVDSFGEKVLAVRVKGSPMLTEEKRKTVKRGRKKIQVHVVPTGPSKAPAADYTAAEIAQSNADIKEKSK
jgi:hypothetical protein